MHGNCCAIRPKAQARPPTLRELKAKKEVKDLASVMPLDPGGSTKGGTNSPNVSIGTPPTLEIERKYVKIPPRQRMLRFTLAWFTNITAYLVACVCALVYGVVLGAPVLEDIVIAWVVGLAFVWLVIEPSEVAGIILLPQISQNERNRYPQERKN